MLKLTLQGSPLGKDTPYITRYNPSLLFALPRAATLGDLSLPSSLTSEGVDIWHAYELSWLNLKGKPIIAYAEFVFPLSSPRLIESKALKLYLHSFNQTRFPSTEAVRELIQKDLSECSGAPVSVKIFTHHEFEKMALDPLNGICIDDLDVETDAYTIDPSLLKVEEEIVEECLYSHLLKSNCLVTHQPDWGHVFIHYKGKKINHASLLKYIISYRCHEGFHEQCIEWMYKDIMTTCKPEKLSVFGRYTRRGGIDINPFRSNWEIAPRYISRLFRQ